MISLNWVKDYIDIEDQDLNELALKVTEAGINVEKVVSHKINNLVIGEVLDVKAHPDSDHLNVCTVNIGKEVLQIVCGAPNVRKDLKVIVAKVGAVLPGEFEIKKSKIRGEESNGMICALFELGLEEKTEENYNKGITELDSSAPVGKDPLEYLGLDDTLYELDIHKHRNNDCYYHIGFAYEISAILNRKVTLPDVSFKKEKDKINFDLEVDTDKCSYYLAREVRDVKIKESPEFIKKRLLASDMRPINNVVDISNYVMLEFGQPLHFFDKDKLGNKIVVRNAKEDEHITTLDNIDRKLSKDDIVITDGKNPVCIAGVMGGLDSEVTTDTKNILIESAIFDPVSIRNTSKRLDLPSEASIRYGKGLNYEYTNLASERACHLLEKYADAKVLDSFVLVDKEKKEEKKVKFTSLDVSKILGMNLTDEDIKTELERLDFEYKYKDKSFDVVIPKRRLDIDPNVNDIAEEIGRLYGYNNLESTLPNVLTRRGEYKGDVKYRKIVSKRLRTLGLTEVKNYTLVSPELANMFNYEDKEHVILPNPMSIDKSVVRTTLIPSLINNYKYNKSHSVKDISIYEIAKTYDKNYNETTKITGLMTGSYIYNSWKKDLNIDFYLTKGVVEDLLNYMGYESRYSFVSSTYPDFHPGICADIIIDGKRVGVLGRINPKLIKEDVFVFELDLDKLYGRTSKLKYKSSFKYPSIEKDMAFILDKDITSDEVIKVIKRSANNTLQDVLVFDVYSGENIDSDKKSIAFHLIFNGLDRTLTDDEVMKEFNKIIEEVKRKLNAIIRDK